MCFAIAWSLLLAFALRAALVSADDVGTSPNDLLDLRLHVAWGGGEERGWSGRLGIEGGVLSELRVLGTDSDAPGLMRVQGGHVVIHLGQTRTYDGFEVRVQAPASARVELELLPQGETTAKKLAMPLETLLHEYRSESLDDRQNRVLLRRAPADAIRWDLKRDHLVLKPGEILSVGVEADYLNVPAGTTIRSHAVLRASGRRDVLWERERRDRTDAAGGHRWPEPLEVPVPDQEGVYELEVSYAARRRPPALTGDKSLALRRLQFVVCRESSADDVPTTAVADEGPRLIVEIDPTQANWWQRMTRMPQWTLLPGSRVDGPLGNVRAERWQDRKMTWVRLPGDAWQAYPLPIEEPGAWHEIEVAIPPQLDQRLAISIVEPNSAGKVLPIGVDTAIRVDSRDAQALAARLPERATHQFAFWPQTRTPLLLMTNLHKDASASFGPIRLYRREKSPPPPNLPSASGPTRQAYLFFERPLFPEAFGAADALDAATGRSLEDWQTFWDGAQRMTAYAQDVGYDGIALTIASEGSTLYPSRLWQPTPKHDRGIYFTDERDPFRKDVLELLFRLCDQHELRFVPMLEFATPLPELENALRDEPDASGIQLVSYDQSPWNESSGTSRGRGARYNPLDERVQAAMTRVVDELVTRYGHHSAFDGLAIWLHPEGYSQLPDVHWGLDPTTWNAFCRDRGIDASHDPSTWTDATREAWLDWRCQRIAQLYARIARRMATGSRSRMLYLAGPRLTEAKPIQRALRPTLPRQVRADGALREMGLEPKYLAAEPGIVFLRPQWLGLQESSPITAAVEEWNESVEVQNSLMASARSGALFLHEPDLWRLPSFDAISPFGRDNTYVSLVAHAIPLGDANRRRFAQGVSRQDAQVLFEGGWFAPRGQEASVRTFLQSYRQLPLAPFVTYRSVRRDLQPLVVRTLHTATEAYVYVVNDSPWVVGANLQLNGATGAEFVSLNSSKDSVPRQLQGKMQWNLTLEPYEIAALRCNRKECQIADVDVILPPDVKPTLAHVIERLAARAAELTQPTPLNMPRNGAFDDWTAQGQLLHWDVTGPAECVRREAKDPYRGGSALRLVANADRLTLKSEPIVPPTSRRLSVSLRVKPSGSSPPRVRLVLEVDGQVYYPWAPIGDDSAGRTMVSEWKEFVFRVGQLPKVQESLRIGIEVNGPGEVLLDDLRLFDAIVLDDVEQKALSHLLTVADHQRRDGQVGDCLRTLSSYWPQYLLRDLDGRTQEMAEAPLDDTPEAREADNSNGKRVWRLFRRY